MKYNSTDKTGDGLHDVPGVSNVRSILDPENFHKQDNIYHVDFSLNAPFHGGFDIICILKKIQNKYIRDRQTGVN